MRAGRRSRWSRSLSHSEDESPVLAVMREALRDPLTDVLLAAMRVFGRAGAPSDVRDVARFALHADPRVADAGDSALHELAARHEERRASSSASSTRATPTRSLGASSSTRSRERGSLPERSHIPPGSPRTRFAREEARGRGSLDDRRLVRGRAVAFALADEESDVVLAAVRALGRLGRAGAARRAPRRGARPHDRCRGAPCARPEADHDRALEAAEPLVRSPDAGVASAAVEPWDAPAARAAMTRSSWRSSITTPRS